MWKHFYKPLPSCQLPEMLSITQISILATRSTSFKLASLMARVTSIKFPFSIIQWLLSKRVTREDSDRNRIRQSQRKYFFRYNLVIPKANIKSLLIRSLVSGAFEVHSPPPPSPPSIPPQSKLDASHTLTSLYCKRFFSRESNQWFKEPFDGNPTRSSSLFNQCALNMRKFNLCWTYFSPTDICFFSCTTN